MKKGLKYLITVGASLSLLLLAGCKNTEFKKMNEALKDHEVVVQTYDEESNIIDRIEGKFGKIGADKEFDIKDSEGSTVEKSGVIGFTVGGNTIVHVGSSLILHEKDVTNVFEEYAKKVDVKNMDRSKPFVNHMINDMKIDKKKVILVRSQTGKPLAAFAGNNVSYFATDIDKSTGLLIDGKYLFIYRCDYTIYDIKNMK